MALMAPPQAPLLEITQPDDDMEISSDAGRGEHDNDIDLVDGDDDFDYMLEDSRSEQGHVRADEFPDASRDDIMYDDLDEITYVEEDTMHEDVHVPDEHLSDVSEFHEETGFDQFVQPQIIDVDTTSAQTHNLESFDAPDAQQALDSETLIDTVDYYELEQRETSPNADDSTTNAANSVIRPTANTSELETEVQEPERKEGDEVASPNDEFHEENVTEDPPHDALDGPSDRAIDAQEPSESADAGVDDGSPNHVSNDYQPSGDPSDHQHSPPQQSGSQESTVPHQVDTIPSPKSPTRSVQAATHGSPQQAGDDNISHFEDKISAEIEPRSLHSVIVDYEGTHISLFPPMQEDEADMFLLKDSFLVDETLVELFRACRQVLGDSIGEDTELEIYSEDLDLTISEDSVHCVTTSFSQLIDVYVTLSQQDGVEQPEPFFISLTKKPRFSSRLTALYLAASESKGLSEVQIELYPQEFLEPGDDHQDDHNRSEDKATTGPSSTNTELPKTQNNEEAGGEEQKFAPDTTTPEPVDGELEAIYDESADLNEPDKEGNDSLRETEGYEDYTQGDFEQQTLEGEPEDSTVGESQAELHTAPEAPEEGKSLEHTGGVENRDDESSGSSTVQGENDPLHSYTAHKGSPEHLPSISEPVEGTLSQSNSNASVQHVEVTASENAEWQETDDQVEKNASNIEEPLPRDEEDYLLDPEAVTHDWDQNSHANPEHHSGEGNEEAPQLDEISEPLAENEWDTFGDLDFNVDEQPDDQDPSAPNANLPTSSGTFRVPDDSAEDEDEDSITYDDDELDLGPQPETDVAQARPTSQSPLGKRSREDDKDGADEGSDQESKRLRSH